MTFQFIVVLMINAALLKMMMLIILNIIAFNKYLKQV